MKTMVSANVDVEYQRSSHARLAPPRLLIAHRATALSRPLNLDGGLGDPAWSSLSTIDLAFDGSVAIASPAVSPTVARVGYDGRSLYLGIRCGTDQASRLRAEIKRDGDPKLCTDDCLEIHFAKLGNAEPLCRFTVNPLGVRNQYTVNASGHLDDDRMPGNWRALTRRDGGCWTAELCIPFELLRDYLAAAPGSACRFSIRRHVRAGQRRLSVTAPGTVYGMHRAWGMLVLEPRDNPDTVPRLIAASVNETRIVLDGGRCFVTDGGSAKASDWQRVTANAAAALIGHAEAAARSSRYAGQITEWVRRLKCLPAARNVFDAENVLSELRSIHADLFAGIIDGQSLWAEYAAAPDTHRNIPNCSYAGYRAGEQPLPDPPIVADARACGARGDGVADDTQAFRDAARRARQAGGGAVFVPAGRYRLTAPVRLDASNLVLRGESRDRTILFFERPLIDTVAGSGVRGEFCNWSYHGGNVWIGPDADFTRGDAGKPRFTREGWFGDADGRINVTGPARRGDSVVSVNAADAARLRPGALVLMSWSDPPDNSLWLALHGHERMRDYPWQGRGQSRWRWAVRIKRIEGDKLMLAQPLRMDIRPEFEVVIEPPGPHVSGVGVENLTIEMPPHERQLHCRDLGFNGIGFSRCVDCWAREVVVINADNAINLSASKNVTVRGFILRGTPSHHGTTTRSGSHDNLMTDFRIESQPFHGLNVEGGSTGNVWRRGVMLHGTFDYHRALSYECIRTDIELPNDGRYGGNDSAGPRLGARNVHWNIRVTRDRPCITAMPGCGEHIQQPGDGIYQPDLISDGALVGVQGAEISHIEAREPWGFVGMVSGEKNCIIADHGRVPAHQDLYQAQLDLRLKGR